MSLAFSYCRCYECEINKYITEIGEHDSRDRLLIDEEKDNEYINKYMVDDINDNECDEYIDYSYEEYEQYLYLEHLLSKK